jgi:hypothetical protein
MKPLVLTGRWTPEFMEHDLADLVLDLALFDFVWGPQPSSDQLADHLGPRTDHHKRKRGATHWSDWEPHRRKHRKHRNGSLAEFCQQYETVELWFDVRPDAQLKLIWLLDYFHSYPETAGKLKLRLIDLEMSALEKFGRWRPPAVDVTEKEFETASAAWQAYRAPTPEACFDLLGKDLSALPLLRPVLIDLLEELPSSSTGLGASEMRMLELIARGYSLTNALFHLYQLRQTRIFGEWEYGYLLDGLAFGPRPAVAGLDEELRTLDRKNLRDRHPAYLRSRLSITEFGRAVLAHKEDFSRHNPIDRWWGGTHLTNDNLWRWNPKLVKPSRRQSERGVP